MRSGLYKYFVKSEALSECSIHRGKEAGSGKARSTIPNVQAPLPPGPAHPDCLYAHQEGAPHKYRLLRGWRDGWTLTEEPR